MFAHNVKNQLKTKIDDVFAKTLGGKDLSDLRNLIEKQISSQYSQALILSQKKKF